MTNKIYLLGKLQSDIFRIEGVWSLVLLQPLDKILDLIWVLASNSPELGAILTHKPE
jgi:hypothetical protein